MELYLADRHSLKEKRQVVKSLKDRLRHGFNVSVAEVEDHDKWQAATLAAACIGVDQVGVNRCLNQIIDLAHREREAEVVDVQMEFL